MVRIIDEMNYLMVSLKKSAGGDLGWVTKELVRSGCQQLFVGSTIDFGSALLKCLDVGLIQRENKKIRMTHLGKQFTDLNKEPSFEVNRQQLALIKKHLPQTPLGKTIAVSAIEKPPRKIGKEYPDKLLTELGLIKGSGTNREIDKGFLRHAIAFAVGTVTEEELKEQLIQKSKYGRKAEEFVVEHEKRRLKKEKMYRESKLVRRIGHLNIMKGYDVESFTKPGGKPDRFIEVKCTKGDIMRFYWSARGIKIAKGLRNRFFIYFVWLDRKGTPIGIDIYQNPFKTILNSPRFAVFPAKFVIMKR